MNVLLRIPRRLWPKAHAQKKMLESSVRSSFYLARKIRRYYLTFSRPERRPRKQRRYAILLNVYPCELLRASFTGALTVACEPKLLSFVK